MKKLRLLLIAVLVCALCVSLAGCVTPWGRALVNEWDYHIQKADDITNYDTRKAVEDTCRSMMASYTSDKLTYEQYKDSDSAEQRSWAEQARMRANKTAASYNEYVLKNSFVWSGNVPDDIADSLPYL